MLRAAVVIGSGSASFEMLRYLTERLPVMVTPRWVADRRSSRSRSATCCATSWPRPTLPAEVDRAFDIGGPDVLTYAEMMQTYARAAGLRRRVIIPVPVLSPTLSSHWVGLVTPVPGSLAKPLVESLKHEVVCTEHDIAAWVPDPPGGLLRLEQAILLALTRILDSRVDSRWSSAAVRGAPSAPAAHRPGLGRRQPLRGRPDAPGRRVSGVALVGHRGHRR